MAPAPDSTPAHRPWLAAAALALGLGFTSGCGKGPSTTGEAVVLEMGSPVAVAAAPAPLDPAAVKEATGGGSAEVIGNVVKMNFPRTDTPVQIDGWSNVPPFMGLTSYTAFQPFEKGRAVMMGDLVLFADEVNPTMSAALDNGLEVTALHNHFFFDKPAVYFMHVGGVGSVQEIGQGVKAALAAASSVRQSSAVPHDVSGSPPPRSPSRIDAGKLDAAFSVKGKAKDGMYKATFGRSVNDAMCGGCSVGSAMGMNTWAAFAGDDGDAVVDGDFAVTDQELQPVLKTLRSGGINIVAIHSHVMGETPRMFFLHYWGRGPAADLARVVKAAVDETAWDGAHARKP
jgi:hypothetical protein